MPERERHREPSDDGDEWRKPNRLVPTVEIAVGLTFGGIEYWLRNHPPRVGLTTWPERVATSEWLVLDDDPMYFNHLNHALAGAFYHLAARTNDLGMAEATLYNLLGSLIWEYVIEYDRSVDLNDLIFTTPAGLALGEFGHSLGRLVHQQPAEPGWITAAWTVGLPQSFHDALRRVTGPRGPEVAHRFRLSLGTSRARGTTTRGVDTDRETRSLVQLRLGGSLARMDDLEPAGRRWRGFTDGNFVTVDAAVSADATGDFGVFFFSDTLVAGWRYTDIAVGRERGLAVNLGSALAWRYQSEEFDTWRDQIGMAHLPGLAADTALWGPNWRLETTARIHPDYGGVSARSHPMWAAANPGEVGWSSLEEEGYYHAWGVSGRLRAELTIPHLRAGAEVFAGGYRNHRGRDVREEELTIKQRVASQVLDYDLWLSGTLTETWFVEARLQTRHRWEEFEDLDARARFLSAGLELGAAF